MWKKEKMEKKAEKKKKEDLYSIGVLLSTGLVRKSIKL